MRPEGPQLQEDGLYKAWSVISIPEAAITNLGLPPKAAALTYLESRDLRNWSTPWPNLTNVPGLENVTNIVCSWHGYEFDLKTGVNQGSDKIKLRKAKLEEKDGNIYVVV